MITLDDVSLRLGTRLLFERAKLSVHQRQRAGIVGTNGAGKSSLLGLLEGRLHADVGEVVVPARAEIASVTQQVAVTSTSALDYVIAGDRPLVAARAKLAEAEKSHDGQAIALAHDAIERIDGYSADSRAAQLLDGLRFSEQEQAQPFESFSGGWRMRLNLARALMCRSDILLLDEPTNHLDLDAIIWLESWLMSYPGTLLVISHDRDFLDAVCTHIIHIEYAALHQYSGNYSAFERLRAERLAGQQAQYLKQQRDVAHMQAFVERFRYKASKARQAQSRLKTLERMQVIIPAHADSPFSFSFASAEKIPSRLLSVNDADFGYQGKAVLRGIDIAITAGERIGLLGANGAGKSTLIKALAGELTPMRGELVASRELRIGYFAQHQVEQLRGDETPLSFLQRLEPQATNSDLRNFLGRFAFVGDMALAPIAPLSGGEKARLVLAMIIRQKPNLLLLDEPTNHLDLKMRHALSMALQDFSGALVVVSHDRHLLQSVSDSLQLVSAGRVEDYSGDLDDYTRWLLQEKKPRQHDKPPKATQPSAQQKKERKRREAEARQQLGEYQRRVTQLEKSLQGHQQQLGDIEHSLADSRLYHNDNKAKLLELLQQQAACKQCIDSQESQWLEACEQLEVMSELIQTENL